MHYQHSNFQLVRTEVLKNLNSEHFKIKINL
jgi:hypothetical protein